MKKFKLNSSFRCPRRIEVQTKKLEKATGMCFSEMEERSSNIYMQFLEKNGGRAVPPFTPSIMKPEEKFLGLFTPHETMEDRDDTRPLF